MTSYKKVSTRIIYIAIDILCIFFAYFSSIWLRFFSGFFKEVSGILLLDEYFKTLYIIIPIFVITNSVIKLYQKNIEIEYYKEVMKVFFSNIFAALILMSLTFLTKGNGIFSRLALIFLLCFNTVYSITFRSLIRLIIIQSIKKGKKYKILVLGTGKLAQMYTKEIKNYARWGYEIVGYLAPKKELIRCDEKKYNILGTFSDLRKLHEKYNFDEVIIALHIEEANYIDNIIKLCDIEGIRIKIIPGYYEHLKYSTYIDDFNGIPMLTVRGIPLDSYFNRFVKRTFDILFSIFALTVSSPLLIAIMIILKIDSPKENVFFLQKRLGLNNNSFTIIKFRTMKNLPDELEKVQWSKEDDPRVTKIGTFLRKTSLDEFPQFFNVLIGDMSVVGPRPERPYWVSQFKNDIPHYMLRHYVKSGITGWAQINGLRGDTSIEERIKYDNYYIQNWSLVFDIRIILLTVFGKNTRKNAY